jgi:malto-oligosyltrehalose trehalohydrolase
MNGPNPHGPRVLSGGGVHFRLWAPSCELVKLVLNDADVVAMCPLAEGWHEVIASQAGPGSRYRFELPSGLRVPDPASRFQPEDVHGPSEVIDTASLRSEVWHGRPWHEVVIYEIHIGAFTPQGTFRGAIEKLDHLRSLGITAIQVMPISDFPGRRNWGYDGVLPYATDSSYGRPEDLKAFLDAAHERELMVFLDVVYNHFGPDGNYIANYAQDFFTDRHKTPWGPAINFAACPVREFVIQNALAWLGDYGFDGLRLDAVHAIRDDSSAHILVELAERVRGAFRDRHIHLILENEENQGSLFEHGYTAQWNDDVHHVLHTALTGERQSYYREYQGDSEKLGRALAEGFAFQGEVMKHRGSARGEPSAHLPPEKFVAFLQNHDQIGNRALGDRITATASRDALRATNAVYLLLPEIPMLFMGEEWASRAPFPFFCDFSGELADKVREGRFAEFREFAELRDRIPDPLADNTFESAKLDWENADRGDWLDWYKRILAVRRNAIVPLLHRRRSGGSNRVVGSGAVEVWWPGLKLLANLSGAACGGFSLAKGKVIWQEGSREDGTLQPWSVFWITE